MDRLYSAFRRPRPRQCPIEGEVLASPGRYDHQCEGAALLAPGARLDDVAAALSGGPSCQLMEMFSFLTWSRICFSAAARSASERLISASSDSLRAFSTCASPFPAANCLLTSATWVCFSVTCAPSERYDFKLVEISGSFIASGLLASRSVSASTFAAWDPAVGNCSDVPVAAPGRPSKTRVGSLAAAAACALAEL